MSYVVSNGQVSSGIILNSDSMQVLAGGTAVGTTVNLGGNLYVYAGGSSLQITENGGYVYIDGMIDLEGPDVSFTPNSFSDLVLFGETAATLHSGTTAVRTTVDSGAEMDVYSGGTAASATVNIGGAMRFYEGMGRAITENGGYVFCGGDDVIFAPNTISELTLTEAQSATVHSGTTAVNTILNSAIMEVHSGGTAIATTVNLGARLYVLENSNVLEILENGGYVFCGEANVSFTPNTIKGLTLSNWDAATLHSGTTAANVNVVSGMLEIYSGGMAEVSFIGNGGTMEIQEGGFAVNTTVNSGMLEVSSGGLADIVVIGDAGTMEIWDGGCANTVEVTGGCVYVDPEASIYDTVLNAGGFMNVHTSAFAFNTVVNAGGDLSVLEGGIIGGLVIAEGASVYMNDGAILRFDLTDRTTEDPVVVHNMSMVDGSPFYVIRVSDLQSTGTYALADGAAGFAGKFVITTTEGAFASLMVNGEAVQYNKRCYSISAVDDSLFLNVTPEDAILVDGRVIRYDGSLVIHTGSGTQPAGSIDPDNWNLAGTGSFGGGTTGLLWQEKATGEVYMQQDAEDVSDLTAKSNLLGVVSEGYEIRGIGDFFGTGLDGALLLTPSFGDSSVSLNYGLAVWAREGNGDTVAGWLGALVNTWEETGELSKLKGDYQSLEGEARNQVINAYNYRYQLVGTADFNGDGKTDVMLRNNMPVIVDGETITGSGDVFIFLTDSHDNVIAGNRPQTGICYAGCATGEWNLVGFGDFNGDGTDDALLSDGTNLAGWKIVNGQRTGDFWFGPLSGCQFCGVGDYNGDGTDDFLVSDPGGNYAVWTVNNGAISGSIAIA